MSEEKSISAEERIFARLQAIEESLDGNQDHDGLRKRIKKLEEGWWTTDKVSILVGLASVGVAFAGVLVAFAK